MCRLIESLKIENRSLCNVKYHNERMNKARREAFGSVSDIDLAGAIQLPADLTDGVYKCRILYKDKIEAIEFAVYVPRAVQSLKLVEGGDIDYHLKYEDRSALAALVAQKGEADDILIIKDGYITDTSYSNIAFFDGTDWYTPDTYLLNGTKRQGLLANGTIKEKKITPSDLSNYTEAKMINAMLDFSKTPSINITNVLGL